MAILWAGSERNQFNFWNPANELMTYNTGNDPIRNREGVRGWFEWNNTTSYQQLIVPTISVAPIGTTVDHWVRFCLCSTNATGTFSGFPIYVDNSDDDDLVSHWNITLSNDNIIIRLITSLGNDSGGATTEYTCIGAFPKSVLNVYDMHLNQVQSTTSLVNTMELYLNDTLVGTVTKTILSTDVTADRFEKSHLRALVTSFGPLGAFNGNMSLSEVIIADEPTTHMGICTRYPIQFNNNPINPNWTGSAADINPVVNNTAHVGTKTFNSAVPMVYSGIPALYANAEHIADVFHYNMDLDSSHHTNTYLEHDLVNNGTSVEVLMPDYQRRNYFEVVTSPDPVGPDSTLTYKETV